MPQHQRPDHLTNEALSPLHTSLVPDASAPPRPPVLTAEQALVHVELVLTEPLGHEHACLFLDSEFRPSTCIVMEGSATDDDDALTLMEFVVDIANECGLRNLIVVTSRPGQGFHPQDINRWFALDHLTTDFSLTLLEWFVCNETTRTAVSALAGEPTRWPGAPSAPSAPSGQASG